MEPRGFRFEATIKTGSGYKNRKTFFINSDDLAEAMLLLNGEVPLHTIEKLEIRRFFREEKIIS